MKVKTSELSGVQLDVAVALALEMTGGDLRVRGGYGCSYYNGSGLKTFSPSTDWKDCGELMESFSISCYQSADPVTGKIFHWVGVNELTGEGKRRGLIASNPRVAICRAVVAAKLGDEVDIPDELMEVGE